MLSVRWMVRADLPAVVEIEWLCFQHPWTAKDFERMNKERSVVVMVVEEELNDEIVGYIVYESFENRICLMNLGIKPCYQRHGIGSMLVDRLASKLAEGKREKLVAEVRETNVDAQLFFKKCGFKCVKTMRGYYDEVPGEDAYLFERRLDAAVTEPCGA